MASVNIQDWTDQVVREDEVAPYIEKGEDFINDGLIRDQLREATDSDSARVRDILSKSLALQRLEPEETAALLGVQEPDLWEEIFETSLEVKNRVYGPRIVTFAPLYCSNLCVNSCLYCGFRKENTAERRRMLTLGEVRAETEALVSCGHKRLIVVYGEHPLSDVHYMADTIRTIYDTKVGNGEIRRVNVNAAPLDIDGFRMLRDVGIGTFQVFQETYHHETYRKMHPRGIKADYRWRLYALHRAQEAGIDDVAIGALFGLYDWRFEVMGLLYHAIDLERCFDGVGPHTISFPRLMPAANSSITVESPWMVGDKDFKRLVAVLRLSVPYTGLIITAREKAAVRREVINVGCTQTDASTRIGIGAYSEASNGQEAERQQFLLGDTRNLDEVIRELAGMGYVTSFCTSGYRCGRTGRAFMDLARSGRVRLFCMPNALLTFKEYLLDYGSGETREAGEALIVRRLKDIDPRTRPAVEKRLREIDNGARDLRF